MQATGSADDLKAWGEEGEAQVAKISEQVHNLNGQHRALKAWSTGAQAAFADLSKKDSICTLEFDFAKHTMMTDSWMQSAVQANKTHVAAKCDAQIATLRTCLPKESSLDDPKIMDVLELQKQVAENPLKPQTSKLVAVISTVRNQYKQLQAIDSAMFPGAMETELKNIIKHGRKAIGVDYVLEKMQGMPADPAMRDQLSKEMSAKLKQKGITLPTHMLKVLDDLLLKGAEKTAEKAAKK